MVANMNACSNKKYDLLPLVLALCMPCLAWGQVLTDPTRPAVSVSGSVTAAGEASYAQVKGLQSVMLSPGHCAAIIDGKTVALGAKHGGEMLIEITERGVVLQGERGSRSLTLFSAVGMKMNNVMLANTHATMCKIDPNKQIENPAKQSGTKEKK